MKRWMRSTVASGVALLLVVGGLGLAELPAAALAPAPGTTVRVSLNASGDVADRAAGGPSVSADGRYVAFESTATNLGGGTSELSQIYVRDVVSGAIRLVSAAREGEVPADSGAFSPAISLDGRYVAFSSSANNLENIHVGTTRQIFVRDLAPGGITRLVTIASSSLAGGAGDSTNPSISLDGTAVAFQSTAYDLLPGVPVGSGSQIYRADLTGSLPALSLESVSDSAIVAPGQLGNAPSEHPSISSDGQSVAFDTLATNLSSDLIPGDTSQVFVHRTNGRTLLVSAAAGAPIGGGNSSFYPSVSADGNVIAYHSYAQNLSSGAPVPTPGLQVFVRDLTVTSSQLVSVLPGSFEPGNADSTRASISADGLRVAFTSIATDLTAADSRMFLQVYLRDRVRGVTSLVSVSRNDPMLAGDSASYSAVVSGDGTAVAFASVAQTLTASSSGHPSVYLRDVTSPRVERISGADRYAGAAAVSASAFDPGVPVAYVASGADFPDALAGSAAAGYQGAPVLLVMKDAIPASVGAELTRLRPSRIVILGGPNTIGSTVETALAAYAPSVWRNAGADRYAGSAEVSRQIFPARLPVVYVASGAVFPDALAGSAAAGKEKGPVLLVGRDGISDAVRAELMRLSPQRIVVLGGPNTVSDSVFTQLGGFGATTTRLAGADRYAGSAAVSAANWPTGSATVYVASGAVFPDALSGSAAAIANGAPVLLVTGTSIPTEVQAELTRLKPTHIVVLGGPNTVSDGVVTALDAYLAR